MAKFDLDLDPPYLNAAGTLGFFPSPYGPVDLGRLGAFVTNPISWTERTPAHGTRLLPFPGGVLLHTGYPNPGFHGALQLYADRWARAALPVVVHLLAADVRENGWMIQRLEGLEGVLGIELGLPPEIGPAAARELVRAAVGELPVIVRLPMERAAGLALALADTGAAAVSLAPPRGALPGPRGLVHGRLYGPAVFPGALAAVQDAAQCGLPVIGAGGIYSLREAEVMRSSGAAAVQLDTILWRGGW